jgi:hypothetical protein
MKTNACIVLLFFHHVMYTYCSHTNNVGFRYGIPTSYQLSDTNAPCWDFETAMTSSISLISKTTTAARKIVQRIPSRLLSCNQRIPFNPQFSTMQSHPALIRKQIDGSTTYKTSDVSSVRTLRKTLTEPLSRELAQSGVYFGLTPKTLVDSYGRSATRSTSGETRKKRVDLRESMSEALEELRIMRVEMEQIRKEMHTLQQQLSKQDVGSTTDEDDIEHQQQLKAIRKKQKKEYEKISKDVEQWARQLLTDQLQISPTRSTIMSSTSEARSNHQDIEWTQIQCAKMLESKFNSNGQTYAYLTYMKDSRDSKSKAMTASLPNNNKNWNPDEEYPCIKMYSTLDAPIEEVCIYLSNEKHVWDYNSMIQNHKGEFFSLSWSDVWKRKTHRLVFIIISNHRRS